MKEIDIVLVRACQHGNHKAFERIFQTYREPIFRLAYRFTGNREDAEDLAQEIFLKVFEHIGSFRFECSFETWLYKVAVNTCLNFRRDAKPVESLNLVDDELESAAEPKSILEQVEQMELQQKIEMEIASLPSPLKLAFVLVVLEGLTYKDASQILNLSVDAVRMRVSRARQILRNKIKRYLEGDEK